ncbi:hypothetical protein TNCV_3565811 [Trichonephila clavipes]|nr:hypothetical protein TNCV_3565811 [Trichonephila clavipes]
MPSGRGSVKWKLNAFETVFNRFCIVNRPPDIPIHRPTLVFALRAGNRRHFIPPFLFAGGTYITAPESHLNLFEDEASIYFALKCEWDGGVKAG